MPNPTEFDAWFPGLARSGTQCADPRGFILCFPSAGSAEDMYTSEGTGPRRSPSPLLAFARQHAYWVLAAQAPGRGQRLREPLLTSAAGIARRVQAALDACPTDLNRLPCLLLTHSYGCWIALEWVRRRAERGLPLPRAWSLSAMPSPALPIEERRWRPNAGLSETEFQDEVRGWDANVALFEPSVWSMYEPTLRADFTVFDTYPGTCPPLLGGPLDLKLQLFYGARDRRVTKEHVEGWREFVREGCVWGEVKEIDGSHMFPQEREAKTAWLDHVVDLFSTSIDA